MTTLARKVLSDALAADGWVIPAQSVLDGSDGCTESAVRVLAEYIRKNERLMMLMGVGHDAL